MSDRPIVYTDSNTTYYRASSLTQCPRAFNYARQSHPPRVPKPLQEAFDYGLEHEEEVLSMLAARGFATYDHQLEVITDLTTLPNVKLIGHIDGRTRDSLLEVKCLNHANTESFLNNPHSFNNYMVQVKVYAHALILETIVFAIYDKDEKELKTLTLSARDLPSWDTVTQLVHAREIAWSVYQSTDELPDCPSRSSYCPYYYLHEDESEVIDDPILEVDLASYVAIQSRIASLEKLEALQKAKLKTSLSARSLSKGRVGGYKFSYSSFNTRRLDIKRVGEYLKENKKYDEFISAIPSTRLSVEKIDE